MVPFFRRVVLHKIILCYKFILTGTKEVMKDISLIHYLKSTLLEAAYLHIQTGGGQT